MNIAVRDALAAAELHSLNGGSRSISAPVLKSILWVLWFYEGEALTIRAIAVRAGSDDSTTTCALRALVENGFIEKLNPPRHEQKYKIITSRLRDFESTVPLVRISAGPNKGIEVSIEQKEKRRRWREWNTKSRARQRAKKRLAENGGKEPEPEFVPFSDRE